MGCNGILERYHNDVLYFRETISVRNRDLWYGWVMLSVCVCVCVCIKGTGTEYVYECVCVCVCVNFSS